MKHTKTTKTKIITGCFASLALVSANSLFAADSNNYSSDSGLGDRKGDRELTAMTARSIEGTDFNFENGEQAGVIDDLIISTDSGNVEGLVISTGFLGLGGPEHLIAYDKLSDFEVGSANLETSLTSQEFGQEPEFDQEKLDYQTAEGSDLRTGEIVAMDLVGSEVESSDGGQQGEVHDWVVDVQTGNVPFVIIRQTEPFAGMSPTGYNYYAVSSDLIEGVREGELVISVNDEAFTTAEYIDEENMLSEAEESSVRAFRYEKS